MIKAIFFDIDGTLVSFKTHSVPENVFKALETLQKKGIRLFIATGRGKDGLDVLHDFPFDGYITLNGQYCFNQKEIIYENTFKKEDLDILMHYLEEHPFPCGFTLEHTKYFNFRNEQVDAIHEITHNDDHPARDCSNIPHEKVYQCMCFIDEKQEAQMMALLPHCLSARWHPSFTDLSPKGGSKQKGIDEFLKYYHLDLSETMAFGDGGNDIPMLKHVALSVAMGNASFEVKAIADYVTTDIHEDGIIHALKHFGLL